MTEDVSSRILLRRASVLIPLIRENGAYSLLFEVRAYDLDAQPGDICFPGGVVEEGENPEETVLRETQEELLTGREDITVLKTLPEVSGPGAVVTPFLGEIRNYAGTFAKAEVDHVFTVPLQWFYEHEPEVYRADYEVRLPDHFPYEKIHGGRSYPFHPLRYDICFYEVPPEVRTEYGKRDPSRPLPVLWGFTAKLTRFFVTRYPVS